MSKRNSLVAGALVFISVVAIGCSSDDDYQFPGLEGESSTTSESFVTDCGTVQNGSLENPVDSAKGELVPVLAVISSNLVKIRLSAGDALVKLQGISTENSRESAAIRLLEDLSASRGAYYFSASIDCLATVSGGGQAFVGQLFTPEGKSYTEELLKAGIAGDVESTGSCGEDLLAGCYGALSEANTLKSAGEITDFLWKPVAESDYNKGNPVIHANPCDATVYVNGQALTDFGPGNGRCNTSRLYQRCGTYGTNIKVEILDNASGLPYFNGSTPYVIVPNGCQRYEFKR